VQASGQVSVLGAGYLGATHAACLASLGLRVHAVDVDADRVAMLASGRAPFHEPGLEALLADGVSTGRLTFGTDLEVAAEAADVHFVCVGTPPSADGHLDLSALWHLVDDLGRRLHHPCLVVGKSTVPVGTAARVRDRLRAVAPAGRDVAVAWNPEFLREGHGVADSLRPERLVLGVESREADQRLRALYHPLTAAGVPVVSTDLQTAELSKVSANAMLAGRISMVNAFAEVCEVTGADIGDLVTVLGLDSRIGPDFLSPGLGFGGSCLPKDTRGLVAQGDELGLPGVARLWRQVDAVNQHQRERTAALAQELLGGRCADRRVTVLGAAFKAGSDDVRDSPALDVAARLHDLGARVCVYDPAATAAAQRVLPALDYALDVLTACRDSELVLVLTDWDEFRLLDPVAVAEVVAVPRVLDGRLLLDPDKWQRAGWQLRALGRAVC
jgi:UDPglucose 6-dehydrogenase